MSDTFLKYFNDELAYLKNQGQAFAEQHPKIAGRLKLSADAIDDPFVARMMESFAFLTARVQHKLDDEYGFITDALLNILYPHYQLPIPAMTISQFTPSDQRKSPYTIERHRRVMANTAEGQDCYFKTVYPVVLTPVKVTGIHWSHQFTKLLFTDKRDLKSSLTISLASLNSEQLFENFSSDFLRFYIDLDDNLAAFLYELLFNHVRHIVIQADQDDVDAM